MNRAIYTALSGIVIAQALKIPTHYIEHRQMQLKKLIETGGMPSSHSCGVTSLATYVGLDKGWNSADFAVSALLGIIVMYDAIGIRRHASEIAIQVNDLDEDIEMLAGDHPGIYHFKRNKRLKETLGHQPIEVIAGAFLGVGVGVVSYFTKPKPKDPFTAWFDRAKRRLVN